MKRPRVIKSLKDAPTAKISKRTTSVGEQEKNPISAVMELGNKLSIIPEFHCRQLSMTPISRFEGECIFGDKKFGPVEKPNKQQAKNAAFQLAWEHLNKDPAVKGRLAREEYVIKSNSSLLVAASGSERLSGRTSPVVAEVIQNLLSHKHPISAFLEYAQARKLRGEFVEVADSGPAHCRTFTYKCKLNETSFPEASARTKQEARKVCAELALRVISGEAMDSPPPAETAKDEPKSLALPSINTPKMPLTKSDEIATHVYLKFNEIKATCGVDLGKVILAAFVIENSLQGTYTVISIGTGNKCLTGKHLTDKGTVVNDCHAEVIARRGLLRFLYVQVENQRKDATKSIFQATDGSGKKLALKTNLNLHLYISTAPCGDGALFTHNDLLSETDRSNYSLDDEHAPVIDQPTQGQLRSKMEVGEGTIPTVDVPLQTFDGIYGGDRLKTMSCSDKICKWNVLGVQGTLLSDLMEPLYIDTLVLGQLFNPGHLSRALCCRIRSFDKYLSRETTRFKLHHVKLDTPNETLGRSTAKAKPISLNWMKYDTECELLVAESGQVIPTNSDDTSNIESRLCKKTLYQTYCGLTDTTEDPRYYKDAKAKVTEYNNVKAALYREFADKGLGNWLHKPREQGMFR